MLFNSFSISSYNVNCSLSIKRSCKCNQLFIICWNKKKCGKKLVNVCKKKIVFIIITKSKNFFINYFFGIQVLIVAYIFVNSTLPVRCADITVAKNRRWDTESSEWNEPISLNPYARQPLNTWWASPWQIESIPNANLHSDHLHLLIDPEHNFAEHFINDDDHQAYVNL